MPSTNECELTFGSETFTIRATEFIIGRYCLCETGMGRASAELGFYWGKIGSRFSDGEAYLPLDLWDSTPDASAPVSRT